MKKTIILSFALLLVATTLQAQLSGEFFHANDGHYYFRALNSQNTSGTIKITAISYYNDIEREEYRTIQGYGDGFILGPTTPWKWFWHKGDRIYITYPDGSSVYWESPYTESNGNVSFQGSGGPATPPNHNSDGYIYQGGTTVRYNGYNYHLYKKNGYKYIYDKKEGWIKLKD